MKGYLDNGFEFELDENKLDDARFFEELSHIEDNPFSMFKIIEMMLGKEQKERLYKHLETEDGRVPVGDLEAAVTEMFEKSQKVKN